MGLVLSLPLGCTECDSYYCRGNKMMHGGALVCLCAPIESIHLPILVVKIAIRPFVGIYGVAFFNYFFRCPLLDIFNFLRFGTWIIAAGL